MVEVTEVEMTIAEVVQFSRVAKGTPVEVASDQPPPVEDEVDEDGVDEDRIDDDQTDEDPSADGPHELVVETIYEETVLDVSTPIVSAAEAVPSDASAVPELSPSLLSDAWEPAIVVDYPVEPSEDHPDVEVPEGSDDPGRPEPAVAGDDRRDEAASMIDAVLFGDSQTETTNGAAAPEVQSVPVEAGPVGDVRRPAPTEPEEQLLPLDVPDQPTPAVAPKPVRRKRASVPSWDEIVFGGPKEK